MSKYLTGFNHGNQTDRTLWINFGRVRLEYSIRYLKLISHVLLNIHALQNWHVGVCVAITSDLYDGTGYQVLRMSTRDVELAYY